MPLPAIVPIAMGLGSIAAGLFGQRMQSKSNLAIARYQTEADQQFMREMNEYNTPANQMRRFQEAGLNPHLIYGQGTPGNQSQPVRHADIRPTDYQSLMEALPLINQTAMTQAQVQATNAQTVRTHVMTELNKMQKRLIERNPLLNDEAFLSVIDSLKATAELKRQEADWAQGIQAFMIDGMEMHGPAGVLKMETELKRLIQRFNLEQQDMAIKAEILKSAEFRNAISELEVKFLEDGDLAPGHIWQFLKMFLLKLTPSQSYRIN